MAVFLKIVLNIPCEGVADACQKALDMGGEPVAVMDDDDRVILDPRQIRDVVAQLN